MSDDQTRSAQQPETDHSPKIGDNPWLMSMVAGWIVLAILGVILIITDTPSPSLLSDPGMTGVQLIGVGLLSMAGALFVAWLVCGALLWPGTQPPKRSEAP